MKCVNRCLAGVAGLFFSLAGMDNNDTNILMAIKNNEVTRALALIGFKRQKMIETVGARRFALFTDWWSDEHLHALVRQWEECPDVCQYYKNKNVVALITSEGITTLFPDCTQIACTPLEFMLIHLTRDRLKWITTKHTYYNLFNRLAQGIVR